MSADLTPPPLVRLASADNFRDVAGVGPGYPTADGGRVRRGVFFRANELQLTDEDILSLVGLGLSDVHDLRSNEGVTAHPDPALPGTAWRQFDVLGIPMDALVDVPDEQSAVALVERVYRGFVEDPRSRLAFGAFLTHLAQRPGPQLFHCTTGKDRTGWAAALLLHLAGVDDDVVLEDYLLTNQCTGTSRARYLTMVETALGADRVGAYERVLVADADYLATAYAAVATSYGSVAGYLIDGLGLTRTTLDTLAGRLRA